MGRRPDHVEKLVEYYERAPFFTGNAAAIFEKLSSDDIRLETNMLRLGVNPEYRSLVRESLLKIAATIRESVSPIDPGGTTYER